MRGKDVAIFLAISAAVLYAINIPVSKVLLRYMGPTMLAASLYLGAGLGLLAYRSVFSRGRVSEPLTKDESPYVIGMIVLDIAAPILLMLGLQQTASSSASLLNNFEIVATSLIALLVFGERISPRLWVAIVLVVASSMLLGFDSSGTISFDEGSLLILAATCCWGLENNCTRKISSKDSTQITTIKGLFSGLGSLTVAIVIGEEVPGIVPFVSALVLGLLSYGLSIDLYIRAQRGLGAAKTSAYYSIAPFIGALIGIFVLGERPEPMFFIGLGLMVIATALMVLDNIALQHTHQHEHVHTHSHSHDGIEHVHEHTHSHSHLHVHSEDMPAHDHTHAPSGLVDHTHH